MHFIVFFNSPQNLTEKAVFTNAALPVIKNPKDVSDSTCIPSFPPYLIIWGVIFLHGITDQIINSDC